MTGGALRPRPANTIPRLKETAMPNPVKIVAILTARPGKADALKTLLDGMIIASRAEPGNLRYDLWHDSSDLTRFVLDELYADAEAVAAHRATPHFQAYLAVINDLAERTALVLSPVNLAE